VPLGNTEDYSDSSSHGSLAEQAGKGKQSLPLEIDLEKAKALAVGNSDRLKDAEFQLRASTRLYKLGIREWLPRIELGYSGSDTVIVGAQDSRLKSASVGITQPLFSGGRGAKQRRLAELQLQLLRQDYEKLKYSILDDIAHLFTQRIIGSEKQTLQKDIYQLALAELEIAQIQYQAGAITQLDLVDTELQAKNLDLSLKATQLELQNLDYQLKKLIGVDLDTQVHWRGAVDADYSGIPFLDDAETLVKVALENNPEIKSQRFAIYRLSEELKAAKLSLLPTIDAEASFSVSGESFPLQEPGFSVSLIVSFPENRGFPSV
jgi:outer membrane protein TolC